MYCFKTRTGHCSQARHIDAQAPEAAICVGVLNCLMDFERPQSVRIARSCDHGPYLTNTTDKCNNL